MGVLRFGLFGFQIHIQPGFWLFSLLLVGLWRHNLADSLLFMAIVFVSILVHELGHAFAARRAGLTPVIVIHAFGGITRWIPLDPLTRGRAIAIAMAGPAAGILVAALSAGALIWLPRLAPQLGTPRLGLFLTTLGQLNGLWSVLNLLPMLPFDGGQILAQLLGPKRRMMAARISLVVGLIAAGLMFRMKLPTAAVVFALAAVAQYVMTNRAARKIAAIDEARVELLLKQARQALDRGDTETAEKAAEAIIGLSPVPLQRREAAEIFTWAALGQGQHHKIRRVLDILTAAPLDPLLQAAILEADGDAERAIACLRQARVAGDERPQLAASLVRLLLSADRYGEAALTTIQILDHISEDEARQVMSACREGGRPVPAAELGMALFSRTRNANDLAWALVNYSTSGNCEAVTQTLEVAVDQRITPKQLLDSPAFESLAEEDKLRQLVLGVAGATQ